MWKIPKIGIQSCTQLLCLARHWFLGLWDCRLLRRLGCYVHTRTWKCLGLLLLSTFLLLFCPLSVHNVNAQEATNTKEWRPLFPTSTPVPTGDIRCPGHQPEGWGYKTPDPLWLMRCSQCVTPAPPVWPTEAYYGLCEEWGLQTRTGCKQVDGQCICNSHHTPEASVTPTTTGTPYQDYYWKAWNKIFDHPASDSKYWSEHESFLPQENGIFVGLMTRVNSNSCSNIKRMKHTLTPALFNNTSDHSVHNECIMKSVYVQNGACEELEARLGFTVTDIHTDIYNEYGWAKWTIGWFKTACQVDMTLYAVYYGYPPEPTPTATPITVYCSSVKEKIDEEDVFTLPVPLVTDGDSFTFGGVEWNISWLQQLGELAGISLPDTITIPRFNVIIKVVQFGNLNILGILINLDLILVSVVGVALIRMYVRS